MDLGLRGKRALVAAASEGLGRSIARGLAAEGAAIAICSRRKEAIQEVARSIARETGSKVHPVVADVSRAQDCARFVEESASALGGLDILITNAGGPRPGFFTDLGDPDWQAAFDLTVMSVVRLVRASLPHLERSGSGRIVVLTSISVKQPIPGLLLSNSLRAAVTGLVKTLAEELAPKGVRINAVAPGRIETDRLLALDQARAQRTGRSVAEIRAEEEREIPLGRYGQPDELAGVAVFVASDRASYVTGTTVLVDGGRVRLNG